MLPERSAKTAPFLFALAVLLLTAFSPDDASALYPDRIVRIVVPFAPGGGTDVIARTLAQEMAKDLGATVIIENKPGAGTIIGTQAVATSEPDGYTLLMGTFANAVNPSLNAKLPYDPHRDFAPVALIARSFNIVVVNPKSPFQSIADLIAAAKADPDKLSYGTFGTGTSAHLAGELFKDMAKVNLTMVPYKGARAWDHRPDRRSDPGDVYDGRQRRFADRGRPVARARRDFSRALAGISTIADRRRGRRSRLRRGELVWPVRAGQDASRCHRPPQQISGIGRSIRSIQEAGGE